MAVFKSNIIPDKAQPNYLTIYGAIKAINILGPTHVIDIILPNMDLIFNSLIKFSGEEVVESQFKESHNPSQDTNMMMVEFPESVPKINFSMPDYLNIGNIPASIFSEISNTILIKDDTKKIQLSDIKNKKINITTLKKAFYAFSALKVIIHKFRNLLIF